MDQLLCSDLRCALSITLNLLFVPWRQTRHIYLFLFRLWPHWINLFCFSHHLLLDLLSWSQEPDCTSWDFQSPGLQPKNSSNITPKFSLSLLKSLSQPLPRRPLIFLVKQQSTLEVIRTSFFSVIFFFPLSTVSWNSHEQLLPHTGLCHSATLFVH